MALTTLWGKVKERTGLIAAGGNWAQKVPQATQHNLRWFFFDGILGAGQDGIILPYLSIYLLALGATSGQIGLMTALASLSATLLLLPGAMLSERFHRRKIFVLFGGGGITRFMYLMFGIIPFLFKGPSAIYIMIIAKVIADGFGNFSYPPWISLTGDIIPLEFRGRYFGSRNLFMAVSGMLATVMIGEVISLSSSIIGYQFAFGTAALLGITASFCFSRIAEPPMPLGKEQPQGITIASLIEPLKKDRSFLTYVSFCVIWNFSIQIVGPFFTVYMVQGLNGTAKDVGLFSIVATLAGLPALRFFGRLSDRWGPRRVMLTTGLLIPIIPWIWILVRNPLQGILINVPAGLIWAGFNLAAFNYLLSLAPTQNLARYTGLLQVAITIAIATGAAFGGLIVTHFGYVPLFILSGAGRLIGILFFARFMNQKVGT